VNPVSAEVLGPFLLRNCRKLLRNLVRFFVELVQIIDLAGEFLQPVVENLFGNFLFIERDQLFD